MAAPKTRPTDADPIAFLRTATPKRRSEDGLALNELFREITGEEPVMWGPSIVGYGVTPLTTTAGTYDWPTLGFSPRKTSLTLYGLNDFPGADELLERLGVHTTSVACLYVKTLNDVDLDVLRELIRHAWDHYTR